MQENISTPKSSLAKVQNNGANKTPNFSFFMGPITKIVPEKEPSILKHVYTWITGGRLRRVTESIRCELDGSKRNELKRTLPYVTFSGIFTKRAEQGIVEKSGLICIDLDHVDDFSSIKKRILTRYTPSLMFVSPSGKGLKVVYATDMQDGAHLQYFEALQVYYRKEIGVEIDISGKDLSRACFLCHDKDAQFPEVACTLDKSFIDSYLVQPPIIAIEKPQGLPPEEKFRRAKVWTDKHESFINGNRNHYVTTLAGACHRFGIVENDTLDFLSEYQQPDFTIKEIQSTVKSIYSNTAYAGIAQLDSPISQDKAIEQTKTTYAEIANLDSSISQDKVPGQIKVTKAPVPPFPIDGLPEEIQILIKECQLVYNTPLDFWAAGILAATAVGMGNSCLLMTKYINNTALWWLFAAPSGSGKSEPLDFAFAPFSKIDSENLKAYKIKKSEYDTIVALSKNERESQDISENPIPPVCIQHVLKDFTPEALAIAQYNNPHGILLHRDELMGWINDIGRYNRSGEVENMLTSWSGKGYTTNRKTQDPIRVDNPCISIAGGLQVSKLHDLAKDGRRDNGMIPRCAFIFPDDCDKQKYSTRVLPTELVLKYETYIHSLLDIKEGTVFQLSLDAETLYTEFFNLNVDLINSEKADLIKEIYAKLDIMVLRLSVIVHGMKMICEKNPSLTIEPETMEYCIRLTEYLRATGLKVYHLLHENDAHKLTKKAVASYLWKEGRITNQSQLANLLGVSHQYINKLINEG
jgi:hypothetical protein